MSSLVRQASLLAASLSCAALASAQTSAAPQAPVAAQGYSIGVFAHGVAGKYTVPDSVAVYDGHVFVGYGDGNKPDGSDGKSTQIVQYSLSGAIQWIYTVKGHNDGLKVDPYRHYLWALQNEDANPNVVAIDYNTHQQAATTFAATPAHGGGYDDVVFRNGKAYLSASNPSNDPNTGPAIVEATIGNNYQIDVKPVLSGTAQAVNLVTGIPVTLNLQDPDSMTLDPSGDLVMTSQADGELIFVRQPGTKNQTVLQLPFSSPDGGVPQVDDTLFTPPSDGYILFADKDSNTIYALHRIVFAPGSAYSSAQTTNSSGATQGFLGQLDLGTGMLTPVVTGIGNPGGMAFVRTGEDEPSAVAPAQ